MPILCQFYVKMQLRNLHFFNMGLAPPPPLLTKTSVERDIPNTKICFRHKHINAIVLFLQLQSHHQYPHVSTKYVLPGLNFCVFACLFVACVFACLFVSVCPNVSTLSSCVTQCVPLKMNRLPPPAPLRVHLTPLPCPPAPSGALCIMLYFHILYLCHFLENKSSPIPPLRKKFSIPCNS